MKNKKDKKDKKDNKARKKHTLKKGLIRLLEHLYFTMPQRVRSIQNQGYPSKYKSTDARSVKWLMI